MKYITGFFQFWYDFLIGDSWPIAAGVFLIVVLTWAVLATMPGLNQLAGPIFFLALVAVFWGVIISEQRR